MMVNIDKSILIWCSGFFDGEGSVFVHHDGSHYRLEVSITNTDMDAMSLFYSLWGGREDIRPVGRQLSGGSRYVSKLPAKQLRWYDEGAYKILADLLPYVKVKRPQFDLALEWIKTIKDYRGLRTGISHELLGIEKVYRKWAYHEFKLLNHKLDSNPIQRPTLPIRERLL